MKKVLSFVISVVLLLTMIIPVYAEEDNTSNAKLTRNDCLAILNASDVDYDSTGFISTSELITSDQRVVTTISIVNENDGVGSKQTVLFLNEQDEPVDVTRDLSYTSKIKAGSLSNVSINAYYYYATTNIGGTTYRLYRPYRLTSSSSVSKNIYIEYYTYGIKYNLNGANQYQQTQHSITNSAYPAVVNHLYSTTNTYSGYIAGSQVEGGTSLWHEVNFTINGTYVGRIKVTSDSV